MAKCCQEKASGTKLVQIIHMMSHSKVPFSTGNVADYAGVSKDAAHEELARTLGLTVVGDAMDDRGKLWKGGGHPNRPPLL